ncbi:hypothetical protein [Kitasatospora sp. NPDC005748]|uniref:hypothetical protein n=1 Tax=Kitasatospora sp. NPDC005748 TaxID=3157063 RepID=UPI0033E187AC
MWSAAVSWPLPEGAPGPWQDVLFRALLTAVVLSAAQEPLRGLGVGATWRPGTLGARVGDRLVGPAVRTVLAAVLVLAGCAFTAGILPVTATVVMAAVFVPVTTVHLSQEFAGYVTEDDDGTRHFKVHHHLHLTGLALLAMAGAGLAAAPGADPHRVTASMAGGLWGAVAAHYVVSAVSKVRKRGLRWPDRRLFPFYLTLFDRFRTGDGERVRDAGPVRLLVRRPGAGVPLLWATLLLEAGTPLMLAGFWPRAAIGLGLVLFHLGSRWLLAVDFRENAMLAGLAALPLPAGAGPGVAPDWTGPVAFAVCAMLSFALDDRVYPFSNLPMFADAYRPSPVVTLRCSNGADILPAPATAGCSTAGLSREYAAADGDPDAFCARVRERVAATGAVLPADTALWVETVDVTPGGTVAAALRRLRPLAPADEEREPSPGA